MVLPVRMTCTVRFEVLITLNVKISVFLDMMPCRLVYVYLRFGGNCCLHLQQVPAKDSSYTFVAIYQTRRRNIPEFVTLHLFAQSRYLSVSYRSPFFCSFLYLGMSLDPVVYKYRVKEIIAISCEIYLKHTHCVGEMQRFLVSNQVASKVAIVVCSVKQKLWGLVWNPHIFISLLRK